MLLQPLIRNPSPRGAAPIVTKIKLLEVTLEELGGEQPAAETEVTIRGVRYRVMQVTPPKTKSSKWRRREPKAEEKKWRLLVQEVRPGE